MFEEFAHRKFNDYINLIEFKDDLTSLQSIKQSSLPPYIVNFFECSLGQKRLPLERGITEELLNKGIIFNINYVIKPKGTLLKFLFGTKETRPVEYIQQKLLYFQFYNHYLRHIYEFINLNKPPIISSELIASLINEVNREIEREINVQENEQQRINLIKLLYHFFLDLTENNPINIKLPKKILSVFFQDKGFNELKKRVDDFFDDEIFIQEAAELMSPAYTPTKKAANDHEAKIVKEIVTKAKSGSPENKQSISISLSDNENARTVTADKPVLDVQTTVAEIKLIEDSDLLKTEPSEENVPAQEIYSDDLVLESAFEENIPEPLTPEQQKEKLLNEIFCEESFRKKIIKKVFRKDEKLFRELVYKVLDSPDWDAASLLIEDYFNVNGVKYFLAPSVKFVDLMENYFIKKQENAILNTDTDAD